MDSLGLVGDGDELDLLRDVEEAFAIKLTDEDLRDCLTLGDLESAVWRRLQEAGEGGERCASAQAFHMLRRGLRQAGYEQAIHPDTALAELTETPHALGRSIERETGLTFSFENSWLGFWAGNFLGVSLFALLFAGITFSRLAALFGVLTFLLGCALARLDPGSFGRIQSVGDAARELANRNYGAFLASGARLNRNDVSEAVKVVAAESAGIDPAGIGQETLLLHKPAKVA